MTTLTIREVAQALGPAFGVERLGSNVYAATDFRVTITINGGQFTADTTDEAAEVLVCASWTGSELLRADDIRTVAEIVALMGTLPE